jgi:hypothetical protein
MLMLYDGQRKCRFFRIMPWLSQCAIYTIIIIALSDNFYETSASDNELKSGYINEEQA